MAPQRAGLPSLLQLFSLFGMSARDGCAAMAFAGRCRAGVLVGVLARMAPHRYRSRGVLSGVNDSRRSRRAP
jgi:hypothetical protein